MGTSGGASEAGPCRRSKRGQEGIHSESIAARDLVLDVGGERLEDVQVKRSLCTRHKTRQMSAAWRRSHSPVRRTSWTHRVVVGRGPGSGSRPEGLGQGHIATDRLRVCAWPPLGRVQAAHVDAHTTQVDWGDLDGVVQGNALARNHRGVARGRG